MEFIIYKTTNVINGKYYIGRRCRRRKTEKYIGSGKILKRSILKYGRDAHKFEVLEILPDYNSLVEREKEIITQQMLDDPLCMNIRLGGEGGGGWTTEQQKINAAKANVKLAELRSLDGWQESVSYKISTGLKEAYAQGKRTNTLRHKPAGWKHTNETKQKIKLSIKESGGRHSEKNSQFGTKWITNGKENRKINNTETLPEGWYYGRVINK